MSAKEAWQGIPREEIPWFPTINSEKCVGCQESYNFCRNGVVEWDKKAKKSIVKNPFSCVVGCSSCAGLCKEEAITFPPLTILRKFKGKTDD